MKIIGNILRWLSLIVWSLVCLVVFYTEYVVVKMNWAKYLKMEFENQVVIFALCVLLFVMILWVMWLGFQIIIELKKHEGFK